ncbi:MAG TPA: hypothetical protein VIL01_03000 [Thermomicrobiales bacterium]
MRGERPRAVKWRRLVSALIALVLLLPPAALAQEEPTVGAGTRLFALPGERVFPEGIAFDASAGQFYVGSTEDGTIFRGDLATGEVSVFAPAGSNGLTYAVGMKVVGGRLVVAGGPVGSVFVYDVATGQLIAEVPTGLRGSAVFLNDVAFAERGEAYVSDSENQRIYRVRADVIAGSAQPDSQMRPWLDLAERGLISADDGYLNGLVLNASGRYLLAIDMASGRLFRIATSGDEVIEVDLAGQTLVGGDGLVLDGTMLYVVRLGRVTVVALADDLASGTVLGSFSDPSFSTPTTAAKVGGCLLVVNSQLGKLYSPELPFTVSLVPIPPEYTGGQASGC